MDDRMDSAPPQATRPGHTTRREGAVPPMRRVGIGVIGCGNISGAYLNGARTFPVLDIRGLADAVPAVAEAKAAEFGLRAVAIEALLDDPEIEIILNLTIPKAHVEVGLMALEAGKHVYSEKPLGIRCDEGRTVLARARQKGLRVGCAPDTFFGGAHQRCRHIVDDGTLGTIVGGTAFFMCPGHERWHPNPAFYYQPGGGPMLDMGPYYITDLINLLGPVKSILGSATKAQERRPILSEPLRGQFIEVEVATHVAGIMEFACGAVVQIATSFDVAGHKHLPLEIYGSDATLIVPDPNRFGGQIQILPKGGEWADVATDMPYADANHRGIGLADMALALRDGRPHRASGELALHVLEVIEAFEKSAAAGRRIVIESSATRPAPLSDDLIDGRLGPAPAPASKTGG